MECPKCGSSDVKDIYYGFLPFELARRAAEGEIVYGGFVLPDDAPSHVCAHCGLKW